MPTYLQEYDMKRRKNFMPTEESNGFRALAKVLFPTRNIQDKIEYLGILDTARLYGFPLDQFP